MKNNKKEGLYFLIIVIIAISMNIRLPYYVSAPGGVINVLDRIESKNKNGSLNMLYVKEYEGTPVTLLVGLLNKNQDISKIEDLKVSDESNDEIKLRNKIMLDNSIDNALYASYKEAGKELKIKKTENIVIATTKDNGINIGDIILKCDNEDITDINQLKKIVNNKKPHEYVNLLVKRGKITMDIDIEIDDDNLIGIAAVTNHEYDNEDINIRFKKTESGASGGLMLSLAIYEEITGIDLLKGRNIAGTGTIDMNGNVGPIDGVKYKIMGAYNNKMDIVLVPKKNYKEAKKVIEDNNYNIKLYQVDTLNDAINYLKN